MAAIWLERQWWQRQPTLGAKLLQPVSTIYGLATTLDRAFAKPRRLPVPVIVVGNIVVGGAGKTPTTIALVGALRERGWSPGVVSRGYGRRSTGVHEVLGHSTAMQVGDEPLLIARRGACPVFVGEDRVEAGLALRAKHPDVNLVVADDGLQHHRLGRDAQLVVVDERGFGNGLLLPAGPLRERPTLTPPPRSVVLYNAAAPSTPWPGFVAQRKLAGAVPLIEWSRGHAARPSALETLRGLDLVAAAGIASPQRFFAMLESLGLPFETCAMSDHDAWRALPVLRATQHLVVTEKDAVKLDPRSPIAPRIWVAPLDFALPSAALDALVALLPSPPAR